HMYGGGGPEPMPTTVRILTATIAIIAATCLFPAVTNILTGSDRTAVIVIAGLFGVFAAVTAISLWRAWSVAWHFTIAVAVALGLVMLLAGLCGVLFGVAVSGGIVWSLTRPETK